MKLRVPRQEFQDVLQAMALVAGGRTTNPIFECVKMSSEGERLIVEATDGEVQLRASLETISIDSPGTIVVPADRLLGIVKELDDLELALDADDRSCRVLAQGSEFKIYVRNAADFPPMATMGEEADLVVDGAELKRMIGLTHYAAARETTRYAINGVLWEKRGDQHFMVATDGRRLARAGGTLLSSSSGDFELIIPSKALGVFDRVFQARRDDSEPFEITARVMPNQLMLRSGTREVVTALVEGSFPKYQDVIPKDSDKLVKLSRPEFHGAIRRAALLTTEDSRAVRLQFSDGQLVISANSPEQGEARLEVPVEQEGEGAIEIGFNPAFITDVLRAVPDEVIRLELKESFSPGVLSGDDKQQFLYVLMPVALSN